MEIIKRKPNGISLIKAQDPKTKFTNDKIRKLEIWLNFLKFLLGSFILGGVAIHLNFQIQDKSLKAESKTQEKEYVKEFLNEAMSDNLEKRKRFAHYFSKLLGDKWGDYYEDIVREYEAIKEEKNTKEEQLKKLDPSNPQDLAKIKQLTEEINRLKLELTRQKTPLIEPKVKTAPVHLGGRLRPIEVPTNYNHDKWGTLPQDHIFKFAAYTSSFDGADDNDMDGDSDKWGIPEWVAFEIKKFEREYPLANRPEWITDIVLFNQGVVPSDDSYYVPGASKMREVSIGCRYVRGHMCPKDTAKRISADAAYNTHTMMNAVPQLQWQNNGIWKELEGQCLKWADTYDSVWVVAGPIFFGKSPAVWLGQEGEMKVAIPDALFKIVIREFGDSVKTIAFIIPNVVPKSMKDLNEFLSTVNRVEELTGLDFLTVLDDAVEESVEAVEVGDFEGF